MSNPPNDHTDNPTNKQGFDLGKTLNTLLAQGNRRKLELYQPNGRLLVRLPLTAVVLGGVVALVAQLLVPIAIALAVLLVMKFRFVLASEVRPADPGYPHPSAPRSNDPHTSHPHPSADEPVNPR